MLSVDFLEDALKNNENCIIITHHVPLNSLIDIKYKTVNMLPYNQWFCSNMDNLIDQNKNKIRCWFYGHTHTPCNMQIDNIQFLCNPIGYPNENILIDFKKTIEIHPNIK
jgi:Icc-related predicted phosphoesterase